MSNELREALKESRRLLADCLQALGPCDHSVGICNCDMKRSIEQSDAALSAEPAQEMTDETKAYAEGRGDQFDDDCAIVRELFHELNDVDVMNDGFINTTRVREMLAYFDVAAPVECSGLECTRAECSALGCLADRINTERERLIADRASRLPEIKDEQIVSAMLAGSGGDPVWMRLTNKQMIAAGRAVEALVRGKT